MVTSIYLKGDCDSIYIYLYGRILLDCDWSIDQKCKSLIGCNQTQHNYFGIIKIVLIYQCAQKARDSLIYIDEPTN